MPPAVTEYSLAYFRGIPSSHGRARTGSTVLRRHRLLVPLTGAKANSHNKIVIPTGYHNILEKAQ